MKEMTTAGIWGKIVGTIAGLFLASAMIMWGWTVIAPHLNAPLFTYWEIFGMYCGLRAVINTFKPIKI